MAHHIFQKMQLNPSILWPSTSLFLVELGGHTDLVMHFSPLPKSDKTLFCKWQIAIIILNPRTFHVVMTQSYAKKRPYIVMTPSRISMHQSDFCILAMSDCLTRSIVLFCFIRIPHAGVRRFISCKLLCYTFCSGDGIEYNNF